MRALRSKRMIALAGMVLVAAALAATAMSAVWATVVHTDTTGGIRLRVASMSVSDFDSGWHTHPGLVVVHVHQGSLQMTTDGCTTKTVAAGEVFVEAPYRPLRAVAVGRAVWTTTFLIRSEDPLASPVASPCP